MADELAKEIIQRSESLFSDVNGIWKPVYQDLADYFMPNLSDVNTQKTEGVTGWTDRIYDTTAIEANQTMATGMFNWLTPSNQPWMEYGIPDFLTKGDDSDEAAIWLGKATETTIKALARSNFYEKAHEYYLSQGVFGTGLLYAAEGRKSPLMFKNFKAGTYAVAEDDEGIVDTVFEEFELTARQAAQFFGEENLGPLVKKALNGATSGKDKKFKFRHGTFPRTDSERLKGKDKKGRFPVASVYVCMDDKYSVRVDGFEEFPFMCGRFSKFGTKSPYGYSPAFLELPTARQLNYITQYYDSMSELMANPRMLIPSNLEGDVDMRAGGATVYDASTPDAVPREWATVSNLQSTLEAMQMKKDAINKAFYVNLFTMLEQLADKRMTAYEIAQRVGEKLEQFTPVFSRSVSELLNPLLRRVFGILYRGGHFGEAPQSLYVTSADGKTRSLALPEIAITSRISLALKALQNNGLMNTFSSVAQLAEGNPNLGLFDNFDMDVGVRELARNFGAPPDLERPMKMVQQMRAQRAKQQQLNAALEQAQQATKAAGNLGKAPQALQDQLAG